MRKPKHTNAKPSLVFTHIELTIDGGDIRQDAMQDILTAMEDGFIAAANRHGLDHCLSRRLRSTDSRRLRRSLRTRGFDVPPQPPNAAGA